MSTNKVPPLLSDTLQYIDWKKKVKILASFTTQEKKKQGAAIFLTLKGPAEEAVLELDEEQINHDDGMKNVLEKLYKLYLKDSTMEKFQALEAFDTCTRKPNTSIQEHIHGFDKLYHKLQSHGTTVSQDLLAFRFLKSCKLSNQDKKLAKGTVTELKLKNMKEQLKKIFPDKQSLQSESEQLLLHEINELECSEASQTFYTNPQGAQRRPPPQTRHP